MPRAEGPSPGGRVPGTGLFRLLSFSVGAGATGGGPAGQRGGGGEGASVGPA